MKATWHGSGAGHHFAVAKIHCGHSQNNAHFWDDAMQPLFRKAAQQWLLPEDLQKMTKPWWGMDRGGETQQDHDLQGPSGAGSGAWHTLGWGGGVGPGRTRAGQVWAGEVLQCRTGPALGFPGPPPPLSYPMFHLITITDRRNQSLSEVSMSASLNKHHNLWA